jgi:hypothetical protein
MGTEVPWVKVKLMIKKILDVNGKHYTLLWDRGAQILLTTYQYAKEAGFRCRSSLIQVLCIVCRVREQEKSKIHGHGTEVPTGCSACKNYRECQFCVDSLSFKENTEYKVIISKLQLDNKRKRWVTAYQFNIYVEKLIGNYAQAKSCMIRLESRLIRPKGKKKSTSNF